MPRQSKAPVRQFSFVNRRRPTRLPGSRPSEARPDGTAASDLPDRDRVERRLAKRPSVWGLRSIREDFGVLRARVIVVEPLRARPS